MAAALTSVAAFGLASNAQADVPFGCVKPQDVPALQQQVLSEGMVPVTSRFTARTQQASASGFAQETVMMHPKTKEGLMWQKFADDSVCIYTKYDHIELYNNVAFNKASLMQVAGKKWSDLEVNKTIVGFASENHEYPMMKANAYSPYNKAMGQPDRYVEYMIGNSVTKKGAVVTALAGSGEVFFVRDIPTPTQTAAVKWGAIFTPDGESLRLSAIQSGTQALALNR